MALHATFPLVLGLWSRRKRNKQGSTIELLGVDQWLLGQSGAGKGASGRRREERRWLSAVGMVVESGVQVERGRRREWEVREGERKKIKVFGLSFLNI